jgi:hypothetical protein
MKCSCSYLRVRTGFCWIGGTFQTGLGVREALSITAPCGTKFPVALNFPVTMRELNESVDDRVSDHAPMIVDLPLTEPPKTAAGRGQP